MATRIDRLWPARTRASQPQLRWALPNESHWDQRQSLDQMWREIAIGKRPCLCAVSLGEKRTQRRTAGTMAGNRIGGD